MAAVMLGDAVVAGEAQGAVLASNEPLSLWGGFDPTTGEIIDRRHPLSGEVASGLVLVIPGTRGSSTTTAVLLEAIREGTAPAAILTRGTDPFLALASIVADEMYGRCIPVVALGAADFAMLRTGAHVSVQPDGRVEVA